MNALNTLDVLTTALHLLRFSLVDPVIRAQLIQQGLMDTKSYKASALGEQWLKDHVVEIVAETIKREEFSNVKCIGFGSTCRKCYILERLVDKYVIDITQLPLLLTFDPKCGNSYWKYWEECKNSKGLRVMQNAKRKLNKLQKGKL